MYHSEEDSYTETTISFSANIAQKKTTDREMGRYCYYRTRVFIYTSTENTDKNYRYVDQMELSHIDSMVVHINDCCRAWCRRGASCGDGGQR